MSFNAYNWLLANTPNPMNEPMFNASFDALDLADENAVLSQLQVMLPHETVDRGNKAKMADKAFNGTGTPEPPPTEDETN